MIKKTTSFWRNCVTICGHTDLFDVADYSKIILRFIAYTMDFSEVTSASILLL